jgi:predicted enzyme related to lactoylglutathione lyase
MANPFVHVELNTTDVAKAKAFYGALFGWKFEDLAAGPTGGPYTLIQVGEGTGGGMQKHPIPNSPSAWLPYVLVDDIKKATDKARSLGAQILADGVEVSGRGTFSAFVDPTGAPLAIFQPK